MMIVVELLQVLFKLEVIIVALADYYLFLYVKIVVSRLFQCLLLEPHVLYQLLSYLDN